MEGLEERVGVGIGDVSLETRVARLVVEAVHGSRQSSPSDVEEGDEPKVKVLDTESTVLDLDFAIMTRHLCVVHLHCLVSLRE